MTRDLIQMFAQEKIENLSKDQIENYYNKIDVFKFVSNKKMYNHKDLLNIFKESDCHRVIDPFTV